MAQGDQKPGFGDFVKAAENPAAPEGLQQMRANAAGSDPVGFGDFMKNGSQWNPNPSYADSAQGWYTGANPDGTNSGWDTGWMTEAHKQYGQMLDRSADAEDPTKLYDWFDRKDATGLALWNDPSSGVKRGDVFNEGTKVSNVYDDFGNEGGNLLMAEFALDAKTKQHIYNDPDRDRMLDDEIKGLVRANTEGLAAARTQGVTNLSIEERQAKLEAGSGDDAVVAGGALGTGVIGAGIGSFAGPFGTVVGGIGGLAAGGVAAWLNQDALTQQVARAQEVVSQANKKYGEGAGFSSGLREYSGVGLRLINPVSNIVQGSYDRLGEGRAGDGREEFNSFDENGERKAGFWWRTADVAATLADSVMQFSTPVGIGLFMAGTAGHVGGTVGTMAQTGAGYSDRSGGFDDYEGGEWAAAIGSVGIDVIQFGMAGALGKAGSAARAAVTHAEPGVAATSRIGRLLPWRASGEKPATETVSGMKFTLDDTGTRAMSARMTLTLLAPSEVMRWVPAAWKARNLAALRGGAVGPDDYYRAALDLAGGNRFQGAIVNGWAEGWEEGIQATLEPMSFSADINSSEVFEAAFYGIAGGAGMSLGKVSAPPTSAAVEKFRAQALYQMRNQTGQLSAAEWNGVWSAMSKGDRRRLSKPRPEEQESVAEAIRVHQEAMRFGAMNSPLGVAAFTDLQSSAYARDLVNANPNADNTLVLAGMTGDHVMAADGRVDDDVLTSNMAAMSAWQVVDSIVNLHTGLRIQAEDMASRLEQHTEALAAATAAADTEATARIQALLDGVRAEIAAANGVEQVAEVIASLMSDFYEDYRTPGASRSDQLAAIAAINSLLSSAYTGQLRDEKGVLFPPEMQELARRSVEMRMARHPFIDSGSFVPLMPQVSVALSETNSHGQIAVHQSVLKALGGDHDGDTLVGQSFVSVPQDTLNALRAGSQYVTTIVEDVVLGTDAQGNDITESREQVAVVVGAPDNEAKLLDLLRQNFASSDPLSAERGLAHSTLTELTKELYDRYTGRIEERALVRALATFRIEVRRGNVDARANLANRLYNIDTAAMLELGRENNEPEVGWLWRTISRAWHNHQTSAASNASKMEFTPRDVKAPLPKEKAFQRRISMEEMANDAQTLAALTQGINPVRDSQKLHYGVFRAAIDMGFNDTFLPEQFQIFVERFAALGSNISQSEMDRVKGRDAVQKRVAYWLEQIADAAKDTLGMTAAQALPLIANAQVSDIRVLGDNQYERADGYISMTQLLLKRSVEIERREKRATLQGDEDHKRKLNRLDRLARRDTDDPERSTTAQLAFGEVFGHVQFFDLLGDSSKFLGPQRTLNQVASSHANLSNEARSDALYKLQRKAPYVMHVEMGNPPYSVAQLVSGNLSGYRIVVDAIQAITQSVAPDRRRQNKARIAELIKGITDLQSIIDSYRTMYSDSLPSTDPKDILDVMLSKDSRLASTIAALIPDAAKLGAFHTYDGKVYAAAWVMDMLVQSPEKAAVTYVVYSKLSEWKQLGYGYDLDREREVDPETGEKLPHEHPRSDSKIRSRFLQLFYRLAQMPDGLELDRLVQTMKDAPTVEALEKAINSEPNWMGDQSELLSLYDDRALYETDPSEVWQANLPGTLQREAITAFSDRMASLSTTMAKQAAAMDAEKVLLDNLEAFEDRGVDRAGAARHHELLKLAGVNRVMFPDHIGPAMRDRFTTKVQTSLVQMQNKGAADEAVAPMGDMLVTADEFGVKQAVLQELDMLTLLDFEDVKTNFTKLADGPVRVGLPDGGSVVVDLTTTKGKIAALKDPRTNVFAKQVLFDTARDVNTHGTLQTYHDSTSEHLSLAEMLEEQTYVSLFAQPGDRLTLAQANRYISTLEAGVRKEALSLPEAEQEAAYFPIQQMINDFLVAYSHRPGAPAADLTKQREDLIIDVATALQTLADLDAADAPGNHDLRDSALQLMQELLKQRFLRDSSGLNEILGSEASRAADEVMITDAYVRGYTDRIKSLQEQMHDLSLTQAERDVVKAEIDSLNKVVTEREERLDVMREDDIVTSVISMFKLTGNVVADRDRKAAIRRFLGTSNRIGRFNGNYLTIDKINAMLAYDPANVFDNRGIEREDWDTLAAMAATVYLAEMSGRAGSSISLTPLVLGPEGETMRRYSDPSWAYLLDGFRSELVLSKARVLARQALRPTNANPQTAVDALEGGLFNEKKLGGHTEMIVPNSLMLRQVLANASVGLAVPVGGDLPKELAAYLGAGQVSSKLPPVTMASTEKFTVDLAERGVAWTNDNFMKLNNHFAATVVLRGTTAAGPVAPDLMPDAGEGYVPVEAVLNSGYQVLTVARLNEAIEKALTDNDFIDDPELEIVYFDVDAKPYGREWANNIYFEGVNREAQSGINPGLAAGMFFGTGAISKQANQNPLDMATKKGKGYRAVLASRLAKALRIESGRLGGAGHVASILRHKAMAMLEKEYDYGRLLDGDSTAVYKLMLQRHVVIGYDDDGNKQVWWAEKAAAWQHANPGVLLGEDTFPLKRAFLQPLSDSQAQRLLGEPGTKGTPGVVLPPTTNIADMDTFPEITPERLETLGMTRLGETVELGESPFSHLNTLPRIQWSSDRRGTEVGPYEERIRVLRERLLQVAVARSVQGRKGPGGFDIKKINRTNGAKLRDFLGIEGMAPMFARLKIPFLEVRDMTELKLTTVLKEKLDEVTKVRPSAVIWSHVQGVSPNPSEGILTEHSVADAFGNLPLHQQPAFEDIVVIDLESFERAAGGDMVEAYKQARDVIRAYTKTGVTIVLGHGKGGTTIRRDLAEHLREGAEGYGSMASSRHFFEPISPATYSNKTRRALESSLVAINQFQGDSLILTANSDYFGPSLSENTTYWDLRPEQPVWESTSLTLIPTQLGHLYGKPVAGSGVFDQVGEVKTRALELLSTPEGRAHIHTITGGDPEGVPIYRRDEKSGLEEPGIRSLDAAMDRLVSLLQTGKHPLTVGETLMIGDLVPLIGTDGTIMLVRVGFRIPKSDKINSQVKTAVGQKKPVKGEKPAKWAASTNELDGAWNVRPPAIIQEVDPDPRAGSSVLVKYDLSRYGKSISEGAGWKTQRAPMPNDFAAPVEPLAANGIRVNSFSGRKGPESKEALIGTVNDYGWLFAVGGIDFKPLLVEYFLGKRARDEKEMALDWATVSMFLEKIASMDHGMEPSEIADLLDSGSLLAVQGDLLSSMATEVFGDGFAISGVNTPFQRNNDPIDRLGQVLVATLMAPGTRVADVEGTSGLLGLSRLDGGAQVTLMPDLLTDALNHVDFPELRDMLFDRVNSNLPRRSDGSRPYVFSPDWQFHMEITNPLTGARRMVPSTLQVSLEYPADENPVNYTQASIRSTKQDASQHVAFVNYATLRGRTAIDKSEANLIQMFSAQGTEQFAPGDGGGFWQMMRDVPALTADSSYKPWRKMMPLVRQYMQRAHQKVVHYLKPFDTSDWTDDEKAAVDRPRARAMAALGFEQGDAVELDYYVRMLFGMPAAGPGQDNGIGKISPAIAAQGMEIIANNVENNLSPVHGGMVPLLDKTAWARIYERQAGRSKPWAPKGSRKDNEKLAVGWEQWVHAAFGQLRESEAVFESIFRMDLDGMMHTYQGATEDLSDMPVSLDELTSLKLRDAESNEFLTSLDPLQQALLAEPIILQTMNATLDALTGHETSTNKDFSREVPASELAKRIEKVQKWHLTHRVTKQERVSTRAYIEEGAWYLQSARDTNAIFHGVINLSIGMRLLNPALWTSAVLEVAMRNGLESAVSVLLGKTKMTAGISEALGWEPDLSREQLKLFDKLYSTMGSDDQFLAVVYDQLAYQSLVEPGRGPAGRALERFARFSALATSDPRFGMVAKSVAKRYVQSAWEMLESMGSVITPEQFVADMMHDPLWLQKEFANARLSPHTMGLNTVAHVRSMKQTVGGKLLMSPIDAMAGHEKFAVNFAGHMLKIPFLFSRFNINAISTVAGLGGADQLIAMFFDQRKSPAMGRYKAFMQGKPYVPDLYDRIDMADVLDSADLVRPFLRGALTHTGLMAMASLAGGLGLSGEDEETKRRRRMAEHLNVPYYYDPRAYENDFRHADAAYLDWLPDSLEMRFRAAPTVDGEGSVSAAVPHWIVRQFLSPVIGIERFWSTGDVRQITWGFSDAFSVLPNSVVRLWNEAELTGDMLAEAAADETKLGTPENNANANQYLMTLVGVYEKALLENSFVNAVRNGSDEYDRDPWTLADVSPDGTIKRDRMGNPEPTKGLTSYVDPETGEIFQGYSQRGDMSARLHQFAENNATAALILSVATGQWSGDSSYLRENMLVNTQEVELDPASKSEAEALILAAMQGQGGFESLSLSEIEKQIWAKKPKDAWWEPSKVRRLAEMQYDQQGPNAGATSLLDDRAEVAMTKYDQDHEVLTTEGAMGVLRALSKGLVKISDPSLRGIYIPTKMREEIEAEWARELVQEGLELGLDDYGATARAKRLWYGNTFEDPNATGLREIVWSDQIPKDGKITYNQLNTTFTLGPDGRPWATPFQRQNLMQALGVPWPSQAIISEEGGLGVDSRGNVVDNVAGINTGLHALQRVEESWSFKERERDSLFESVLAKPTVPDNQYGKKGYGFTPWKDFGGSGGGGGSSYFTKMYNLPGNVAPYGNSIGMVNTSNPIIRRSVVRRERVWSERGRLKQWQ